MLWAKAWKYMLKSADVIFLLKISFAYIYSVLR